MRALRAAAQGWRVPVAEQLARRKRDPYRILISCLLSLRTKDETTGPAADRLLARAGSPRQMLRLPVRTIERLIYPVGFYRMKARRLKKTARVLIDRFGGKVPDDLEALLTLPGVGRKTANLVVTVGFKKPGICVDTHVHRICNRFGYLKTRDPHETEEALRGKLPKPYWLEINALLVSLGQAICHPVSPRCSVCPVNVYCERIGVRYSR